MNGLEKEILVTLFIKLVDRVLLTLAAIWQTWRSKEYTSDHMYSASVITSSADGVISEIHQRKPVIIEPAGIPLWLRVKGNAQTTLPWAVSKKL